MSNKPTIFAGMYAIVADTSCPYLQHLNLKLGEKWVIIDSIAATKFTKKAFVLHPWPEDPADPRVIIIAQDEVNLYFDIIVDIEATADPMTIVGGWDTTYKTLLDGAIEISLRNK